MRSPDKNRYLKAVRHIETEEIPFFEKEMDIFHIRRILDKELPMSLRFYEIPIGDFVELNIRMGNDMVFYSDVWELGRDNRIDAQGRKHYVDGTMKSPSDLKKITYPELDAVRKRLEEVLEAIEGTGLGLVYAPNCAASRVATAMGYEDYCLNLLDKPGFAHEFQKLVDEYCVKELDMVLSLGIDAIQLGIDCCIVTGLMYSRELIEEFQYPILRRSVSMIKSRDIPVCLHIDGDASSLIPDFIDMGVDILNPIEPCNGRQDIYGLKQKYGDKLAFHGNIDIGGVLAEGRAEDVEKEVVEHMEGLAVGGGYIVASSHDISQAVPLENFWAMRDATHNYRFAGTCQQ